MAQNDVQISYDMAEQMADILRSGEQQFEDTLRTVQQIISMLEGGALMGQAGDRLAEALKSKLTSKLQSGGQRMGELAKDIEGAVAYMRQAASSATSMYQYDKTSSLRGN